jgi:GDPmannose 4,6-dehydratase
VSAELETYTFNVNTLGILNILQSVRSLNLDCKVYQASTSEMYGNQSGVLNESTPMKPVSIYGIAKKSAQELCDMYKNAFDMFVVSSILFNHESPRRGKTFITRKIIEYVKKYKKGNAPLQLGNLYAKRDWGHARDYIKAIYLMMIQEKPENYVIATGETHSVKEFVEEAFKLININIRWIGTGLNEKGIDRYGDTIVEVNERYYRDIEINTLIGDYSKAKENLGWEPKIKFKELVLDMFIN